jgi:hypothetical protein
MVTTQAEVNTWIEEGKSLNMKYIVVVCDCFDYSDFPVYCKTYERKQQTIKYYNSLDLHRIMEVITL